MKWHADTRSLSSVAAERPTGRREDMGGSRKLDWDYRLSVGPSKLKVNRRSKEKSPGETGAEY